MVGIIRKIPRLYPKLGSHSHVHRLHTQCLDSIGVHPEESQGEESEAKVSEPEVPGPETSESKAPEHDQSNRRLSSYENRN